MMLLSVIRVARPRSDVELEITATLSLSLQESLSVVNPKEVVVKVAIVPLAIGKSMMATTFLPAKKMKQRLPLTAKFRLTVKKNVALQISVSPEL